MPDGTVEIPDGDQGVNDMSTDVTEYAGDIDQDCAEVALESMIDTHEGLMADIAADSELSSSIVRLSGARKFNREDPIEAAAAELILKKRP